MKTIQLLILLAAFTVSAAPLSTNFTYQGRLTENGQPASGVYDLRFKLFNAAAGGAQAGPSVTNAAVAVTNGLIVAALDFGAVWNGTAYWLEIEVRPGGTTNAYTLLEPRQPVTATPYAIYSQAAGSALAVAANAVGASGLADGAVGGTKLAANGVTTDKIADGTIQADDLNLASLDPRLWKTAGNTGTVAGTHFVGTLDNQALEFKAGGQRALRLEPITNSGAPNVIGGAPLNSVGFSARGVVIGGGGALNYSGNVYSNRVESDFGTIAGGYGQMIQPSANGSAIGGGFNNRIQTNSVYGTIGGGHDNLIMTWAMNAGIASGNNNTIMMASPGSRIGGGSWNTIREYTTNAVIAGGYANGISNNASYSSVGGGAYNLINTDSGSSVIGGGYSNQVRLVVNGATIAGGQNNTVHTFANGATIGGGSVNTVQTNAVFATIAGGGNNTVQADATGAAVGGGGANTVASNGLYSTIAGGRGNTIQTNGSYGAIAGGRDNAIQSGSYLAIGGGQNNQAQGSHSVISGGQYNQVQGASSMIPGGYSNKVAANYAFAAGYLAQALNGGSFVWSDTSANTPFASTALNQFLIRAQGGVGIGLSNPAAPLHVAGQVIATSFFGDGSSLNNLNASLLAAGTVPSDRLSGTYNSVLTFLSSSNIFYGDGSHLTKVNATTLDNLDSTEFWKSKGNAGTGPATNFLGTTDNQALEVRVNNLRSLRLEPTTYQTPNIIAGAAANYIAPGVRGVVIAGGGANNYQLSGIAYSNAIAADFAVIGGGLSGSIGANANFATIAGGYSGEIANGSAYAVLGGGRLNSIGTNSASATLLGGDGNDIRVNCARATISGGGNNEIAAGSTAAVVAGGSNNLIRANAPYCVVSGGVGNGVSTNSSHATVGGGESNNIWTNSAHATIGGGDGNDIGDSSAAATIAGGYANMIGDGATYAAIAGGRQNNIQTNAAYAFIGGGYQNVIQTNAAHAAIGGGNGNVIESNTTYAVIAGGRNNRILADSQCGTIAGGSSNSVDGVLGFAAGLRAKALHQGAFVWGDATGADIASTNNNSVTMRASGGYRLFSNSGATTGTFLAPGGGSWTTVSDRNAKENLQAVDTRAVLEKVVALPVSTWNYKSQDDSIRHLGPMAQEFKAAFGLGESDTGITTVDADGVALAAIQGLHEVVKGQAAQLKARDAEIAALRQSLEELKAAVNKLGQKGN